MLCTPAILIPTLTAMKPEGARTWTAPYGIHDFCGVDWLGRIPQNCIGELWHLAARSVRIAQARNQHLGVVASALVHNGMPCSSPHRTCRIQVLPADECACTSPGRMSACTASHSAWDLRRHSHHNTNPSGSTPAKMCAATCLHISGEWAQ